MTDLTNSARAARPRVGAAVPSDAPIDFNPTCTVWAAKDDGHGFGGITLDKSRPLWRGPLNDLAKHRGPAYAILRSDIAGGWSAEPAPGHRGPLNGYRL